VSWECWHCTPGLAARDLGRRLIAALAAASVTCLQRSGVSRSGWLTGSYSGSDLGSQRAGHIQFGRRPLRRLHCVSTEREGTPEGHGKMDLIKHVLFQWVRLVGAVGIEPATFGSKGRFGMILAISRVR
jgi:hypothetical protein